MTRPSHTHWLRPNGQERSPFRVLVIDTETRPIDGQASGHEVLRLWCARLLRRKGDGPGKPRQADYFGHTAAELGELIDSLARADRTLWIMAHNLNFDLAVTALPVELCDRGWRITEGALTSDSPWCRLAKGSRRLAVADTWSWLPAGLDEIARLLGMRKLELPGEHDEEAAWFARCRRDVAITARAIGQLMDWWDAGRFGNWSITGPATGWSSYRHRRPAPKVLVDPDPEARALEMRAVTGGRRESMRQGVLPAGLYADLDISTAHLVAMSELPLPMRRLRRFESLQPTDIRLRSPVLDVLAECEVQTASPRYPWDSGQGIFYPVGRFRTVLAGPELREALRRGELLSIGAGYSYGMADHMAGWARWLASLLDLRTPDVPPMARLAAKHWSRCVPGKWAGHSSEVLERRPDPRPGWGVERGFVSEGRRPADFLRVGGELWTIARDEWADDAFPAVLAWIQAATRVAVGRMVDALGPAVVSVNTDGVLVDVAQVPTRSLQAAGGSRLGPRAQLRYLDAYLARLDRKLRPFSVRIKTAAGAVTVISPQHLILDHERRLAGIPRRAQRLDRGRYRFTAWPRLRVQLARPLPIGYQTVRRTVNLEAIPPSGWLLESGRVEAIALQLVDGRAVISWPHGLDAAHGSPLTPPERQHPLLRQVLARPVAWEPGQEVTGRPARPRQARAHASSRPHRLTPAAAAL
ncbi:MAG: hypothetical protein E6G44_09750 [Actinobacteria bacterium]|nr:MAG: hypothetical protein E6G44_09750 [Actinomycetota bacterium]